MNSVKELVDQLHQILTDEIAAYSSLAEIAVQTQQAIYKKDVQEVNRLNSSYDAFVGQIEDIESQRLQTCDSLAKLLGFAKRPANQKIVVAALPKELQQELAAVRSGLRKKLLELSGLNVANRILLEASLHAIARNFEIRFQPTTIPQGYQQGGRVTVHSVPRNFVNKIA